MVLCALHANAGETFKGDGEPQPIATLFNTGLDDSGALLPDDFVDLHYSITVGADPVWNGPEAYASSEVPTAWNLVGTDSRWITPRYPTPPVEAGYYRYQTTFDLTGQDPSTASISGRFSADNYLEKILLNGVEMTHVTGTFDTWFDFTIPEGSGFIEGVNTLVFTVMNSQDDIGANHSGLRVEMAGWAMPQVSVEGEGEEEGEPVNPVHPADLNADWRMAINEAIACLAGWQQGSNPLDYAIRAAYLWQNGETYRYIPGEAPPLCWMLYEDK